MNMVVKCWTPVSGKSPVYSPVQRGASKVAVEVNIKLSGKNEFATHSCPEMFRS